MKSGSSRVTYKDELKVVETMFGLNYGGRKHGAEIMKDVYYIAESPNLDCNSYIFRNSQDNTLMLVDPGNGLNMDALFNLMKKLGLVPAKISKVIITHVHVDHLLGLYPLYEKLDPKPEILALGDSARVIREADVSSVFPGNLGITPRMFNANMQPFADVTELQAGSRINFGDFEFQVLDCPGHCPGSMCLYEPNKKILVTGDVVFTAGSFGRVDFPGGSSRKLIQSMRLLSGLDVKYLLPGHMEFSKNGNHQIKLALTFAEQVF